MYNFIYFPIIPFGYYIYQNINEYNPLNYLHFILENDNFSNSSFNNSLFLDQNTINVDYLNESYINQQSLISKFSNLYNYLTNTLIYYNNHSINHSQDIQDIQDDWIDIGLDIDNINSYKKRPKYYVLNKSSKDNIEIPNLNNTLINYQKNSINMKCDKIIDKRNYQKSILQIHSYENYNELYNNMNNIEIIFKNQETKDNITISL
jgi:hypothetical protein